MEQFFACSIFIHRIREIGRNRPRIRTRLWDVVCYWNQTDPLRFGVYTRSRQLGRGMYQERYWRGKHGISALLPQFFFRRLRALDSHMTSRGSSERVLLHSLQLVRFQNEPSERSEPLTHMAVSRAPRAVVARKILPQAVNQAESTRNSSTGH